jgi:hypothetical protein
MNLPAVTDDAFRADDVEGANLNVAPILADGSMMAVGWIWLGMI